MAIIFANEVDHGNRPSAESGGPSVAIQELMTTIGGSVDPDRPRGDLRSFGSLLSPSPDELDPESLTPAAVVALQLGRPIRALACLERLRTLPLDPGSGARTLALQLLTLHHVVARTPGGGHHHDGLVQHLAGIDLTTETSAVETLLRQQMHQVSEPALHYEVAFHQQVAPLALMVAGDSFVAASLTDPPQQGRLLGLFDETVNRMVRAVAVDPAVAAPRTCTLGLLKALHAARLGDEDLALALLASARRTAEDNGDEAGYTHGVLAEVRLRGCQVGTPFTLDLLAFDGGFASSRRNDLVAPLQNYPRALTAELRALVTEAVGLADAGLGSPSLAAQVALAQAFAAHLDADGAAQVHHAQRAGRLAGEEANLELAAMADVVTLLARIVEGRSEEPVEQAASLARSVGAEAGVAFALGLGHVLAGFGQRLTASGRPRQGRICHRAAERFFATYGAPSLAATQRVDLADLEGPSGRHQSQFDRYQEALDLLRSATTPDATLRIFDIGQRLAATASGFSDPLWLGHSTRIVDQAWGILHERLGESEPWSPTGDPMWRTTVDSLRNSARHLEAQRAAMDARRALRRGESARAEALFAEALAAADLVGDGGLMRAVTLAHQERRDEAMAAFDAATRGEAMAATLEHLRRFGQVGQTAAETQSIIELRQRADFASRLLRFDVVAEVLTVLEDHLGSDWWATDDDPVAARLLYARAREAAGIHDESRRWYEDAMALVTEERRRLASQSFRPGVPVTVSSDEAFLGAARLAVRTEWPARGLEYFEANRATPLATQQGDGGGSPTPAELAYRALAAEASGLRVARQVADASGAPTTAPVDDRIASLEAELAEAEAALRTSVATRSDRELPEQSVAAIAAALPPGTLALTWATIDADLLTWSMDHEGRVEGTVLPVERSWFEAELHAVRGLVMAKEPLAAIETRGAALADRLWGAHEERILAADRLLLAPSGTAQGSPIHLIGPGGRSLVRDRPVSFLPSLSAAVGSPVTREFATDGSVAVVGNPLAMRFQRPWESTAHEAQPLPFAQVEADVVGRLHGVRPMSGAEATSSRVRSALATSHLVHLATHGELLPGAPEFSALLLADGDVLAVHDLAGQLPRARLIVLSGCVTAALEEGEGGQFVGLTRSLLASGTPSLISALWEVDDLTACVLMVDFHLHLLRGASVPTALWRAQRAVGGLTPAERADRYLSLADGGDPPEPMEAAETENSPPYLWAPYIAHGL